MRRWAVPLAALAAGSAIFALSAAHGGGLSMSWLPAVMLGVTWPRPGRSVRSCVARLRR